MKFYFYIAFSLLLFLINSHSIVKEHQINSKNNQNTFLVKTNLTKEQIELLLKQYQKNHKNNNNQVSENLHTQLKVIKEKQHHQNQSNLIKSNETISLNVVGEISLNNNNQSDLFDTEDPPEPELENEKETSEKPENVVENPTISLNVINEINSNNNESDLLDTEDPPEPELENEAEISNNPESDGENIVLKVNKTNLLSSVKNNEKNENKNENINFINTNGNSLKSGISIFEFFSIVLLTIIFASFLIYATQPKKTNILYSKIYQDETINIKIF